MSDRRLLWITVLALTATGVVLMTIRLRTQARTALAPGESAWRLTYEIRLTKPQAGSRLRVGIPHEGYGCRVFRQTFSHFGLAMDLVTGRRTGVREAVVVSLTKQEQAQFMAEFDVHVRARTSKPPDRDRRKLAAVERSRYLRSEEKIQVGSPTVTRTASALAGRAQRAQEVIERIVEYCSERIEHDPAGPTDAEGVIRERRATRLGRARAMVALCRVRRVPSRLVVGFRLLEERTVRPYVWVEAHAGKRWLPSDPETGHANGVPSHYLPVRRDGTRVVSVSDGLRADWDYELCRIDVSPAMADSRGGSPLHILNLQRLSPGMKTTLAILLLLPLGALITAFFRNVVGMPTFGTFTPCLLALSFVNSDWRTGVAVCGVIVVIGIGGRRLLDRLRLLMVSRLSVVLTLIVLCMVLAISALDYCGLTPTARAALLPMVILTMVVERFHVKVEEDGVREAFHVLVGTLVVAGCCLAILVWQALRDLALRFPEAHLLVAALLILIGRYTGYRVSELWRFRSVARPEAPGETR